MKNKTSEEPKLYKYASVVYDDDYASRPYSYKTDIENIEEGDIVLVDRNGSEVYGTIMKIGLYPKDNLPYPLEKTKDIIEVVGHDDDYEVYWEDEFGDPYYEEHQIQDYRKLFLNCIDGYISIEKLMYLIMAKDGEPANVLLYYPKLNIFYYKTKSGDYKLIDYSTILISKEMFETMEMESIIVPQSPLISEKDAFKKAIKFCKNNKLKYIDDAIIGNVNKIKANKALEFKSINEIKEYLKTNNKVDIIFPEPDYNVEEDKKIHYPGFIDYDDRLFKIPKFLIDNGYVINKKYDSEKYLYLYQEQLNEKDIENLNIKELSYLVLSAFHSERICECSLKILLESGLLLKLIERIEILKSIE